MFIGALGGDENGDVLLRTMADSRIDTSLIRRLPVPTGTAIIMVDDRAENSIVVDSGANAQLTDLTEPELTAITSADILLLQLEIPLETVLHAAVAAHTAGTRVLLNAAPMRYLDDELLSSVDVLLVNEHEVTQLATQHGLATPGLEQAIDIVGALVPELVVTLGAKGAVVCKGIERVAAIAAVSVSAVDTTGAGDTFCGALSAALARGEDLVEAARFATVAASISVERRGAVPSIPSLAEIRARAAEAR